MCNIVERCLYNLIDHLASKLEADRYAMAYAFISLINFIVHNRTQGESERVESEQKKNQAHIFETLIIELQIVEFDAS